MDSYKVGLHNVGSYLASGRPWLKKISLTSNSQQEIEFPNVTKDITITKVSSSDPNGLLRVAYSPMLVGGAPIQTRALNINSGGTAPEVYSTQPQPPAAPLPSLNLASYSISLWIEISDLPTGTRERVVELIVSGGAQHSVQASRDLGAGTTKFRLLLNGSNGVPFEASIVKTTGWVHICVSTGSGESKLYVDGSLLITNTNTVANLESIIIGGSTAGYTGVYDEMTLWDKKLDLTEVNELYNAGSYYNPLTHGSSANLISHWAFEDNANGQIYVAADSAEEISDRVGSNQLYLNNDDATVDSVFQDAQVGWVSGGGTTSTSNSLSIKQDHQQLKLSSKTNKLYLYADGADCEFWIFASLTNIPSQRMYELTGPGIDE